MQIKISGILSIFIHLLFVWGLQIYEKQNSKPERMMLKSIKVELGDIKAPTLNRKNSQNSIPSPPKKKGQKISLEGEVKAVFIDYKILVASKIEGEKHYPLSAKRRKLQGVGYISLRINAVGKLEFVKLIKSSGHEVLDETALNMVRSAAPFPRFPESLKVPYFDIQLPIQFTLQ